VIIMMVRTENHSYVSDIDARLRNTAGDTIAGINDIMRPVNGQ